MMLAVAFCFSFATSAQTPEAVEKKTAFLLDEFGKAGDCDFGARIDNLFIRLNENQGSIGYVIFYHGADQLPAEVGSSLNKKRFVMYLNFRRYDASRVVFIDGSFRNTISTELWIVPPGAEPPTPSKTVDPPALPIGTTFLFGREHLFFDDDSEFVSDVVRERMRLENEHEDIESNSEEYDEAADDDIDSDDVDEAQPEGDDDRLLPIAPMIGASLNEFLVKNPRSDLQILFYADDQHYDIEKIRVHLMEVVRDRQKELPELYGRITVRFGGYRSYAIAEHWIVPFGSNPPVATPDQRTIDE